MHAALDSHDDLHGQETDLAIIGVFLPHVKTRNFVTSGPRRAGSRDRSFGWDPIGGCVRLAAAGFTADDWGNLLFTRDDVFAAAEADLRGWVCGRADCFHGDPPIPVHHDPRYGVAFADWIRRQMAVSVLPPTGSPASSMSTSAVRAGWPGRTPASCRRHD